jgi:hypothetical protein
MPFTNRAKLPTGALKECGTAEHTVSANRSEGLSVQFMMSICFENPSVGKGESVGWMAIAILSGAGISRG